MCVRVRNRHWLHWHLSRRAAEVFALSSSFRRKPESSDFALDLRNSYEPTLSLACGERVTFFARAKKVTKESTVCRFEGVFAEATSLCLRRTAHFLCAVCGVVMLVSEKQLRRGVMAKNSFSRTDRIGAELRRLLGTMVHEAVRDNGLPSMSVSDVEVTKDFDVATVYVTALVSDQAKEGVKALNELAKEFRHSLSQTMTMRRVPEIRFRYDDSVDRGERIDALLRGDVKKED
jgi:ribosome-binding factor A